MSAPMAWIAFAFLKPIKVDNANNKRLKFFVNGKYPKNLVKRKGRKTSLYIIFL
tara:strand:- start:28702 stop:28863 length:162 start_codon:yes stop_codon:yes gene_type:complete